MMRTVKKRHGERRRTAAVLPILLALLLGVFALPAHADIIYEPYDDDFYAEHAEECRTEDTAWEINARGLRMMESPESDRAVYEFDEIGTRVWIYVIYNDPEGGSWGYTEYYNNGRTCGWIPMNLLWKGYDHDKFSSDHASEISQKSNTVPVVTKGDSQEVYFYVYPGSPYYSVHELSLEQLEDDPIRTNLEYTDEEGRKWGYIGYYYLMEGWICLDHPDKDFDTLWPSGAPDFDSRSRKYYEVTYRENESEVAEISDPDEKVSPSEEGSRVPKEPDGTTAANEPAETEETLKPATEEEKNTETTEALPQAVSNEKLRFAIPAAIAGVAVISAAAVMIFIFRRKKK